MSTGVSGIHLLQSGTSWTGLEGPVAAAATADGGRTSLSRTEFERKIKDLASPLMAIALRLSGRRNDAEDLVQETLFRAYRGLKSFRKGTHFRAWLFRILHNVFINVVRRRGRAPAATDPVNLAPAERGIAEPRIRRISELPELADHHFDDQVKAAVDALPEVYRVPMILFSLGEMSYQEIADTLDIPVGTVMSRLHRARSRLREQLHDYGRRNGFPSAE